MSAAHPPASADAGGGSRIRVTHVITNLESHGAQHVLARLLEHIDDAFASEVVSLEGRGDLADRLEAAGADVVALDVGSQPAALAAVVRLARRLRRRRPHIVQTWMYHADLVGGLAGRMAGVRNVVWGIRQSDLQPGANPRSTILTARAAARLSRVVPARIVCGSEAAREVHRRLGYDAGKMVVISNGYEVSNDLRSDDGGDDLRRELGLPADAVVVGRVGRYHPQKDHPTFLRAAALVAKCHPEARFLLCGDGVDGTNLELMALIRSAGISSAVELLGERQDMHRVYRALDICCSSSSYGEGFPNVVAEAMAVGTPVVATDVGDSARIVGDTGIVVPPADAEELAGAIGRLIDAGPEGRRLRGDAARRRIAGTFGIESMVSAFEALYRELAHVRD